MIDVLVWAGYSYADVRGMTIRQVLRISGAAAKRIEKMGPKSGRLF